MVETNKSTAVRIGELLNVAKHQRLVFAESCTGGMAAALITQVPGISEYFCGSAVTYRVNSKTAWLGVPRETIELHSAESRQTTNAMAIQTLKKTPEATIACAITGHLGPDASPDVDGIVFVSIAVRSGDQCKTVESARFTLNSTTRQERQLESAELLLRCLEDILQN